MVVMVCRGLQGQGMKETALSSAGRKSWYQIVYGLPKGRVRAYPSTCHSARPADGRCSGRVRGGMRLGVGSVGGWILELEDLRDA